MVCRNVVITGTTENVASFLEMFKGFPVRQKAASFGLDRVMEKMNSAGAQ